MSYIPYSKTEMMRDIRGNCAECMGRSPDAIKRCTSVSCRFHKYIVCDTQIDAFDMPRAEWLAEAKRFVDEQMPSRFWWSDLRHAYDNAPASGAWWDALATILVSDGWVRLDETRTSHARRRKRSREFCYTRKAR